MTYVGDASADLDIFVEEYEALPPIRFLDDYVHYEEQLIAMRSRSAEWKGTRAFAMSMTVYWQLREYERRIGMPLTAMPLPDGTGGVVAQSIVPEDWLPL